MRKFSFLSLCFSAVILLASCTKEKALPPAGDPPPTVIYSNWTEESTMSWSDTLVASDPYTRTAWTVPVLTQSMIDNGAVLVYARTNSDANVRIFPATIFDQNNSDFEKYQSFPVSASFELLHSKSVGGVFETPTVNSNISFRYILLENAPPANARIATGSAAGFNMDDLKAMSYQDLAIILGIPN